MTHPDGTYNGIHNDANLSSDNALRTTRIPVQLINRLKTMIINMYTSNNVTTTNKCCRDYMSQFINVFFDTETFCISRGNNNLFITQKSWNFRCQLLVLAVLLSFYCHAICCHTWQQNHDSEIHKHEWAMRPRQLTICHLYTLTCTIRIVVKYRKENVNVKKVDRQRAKPANIRQSCISCDECFSHFCNLKSRREYLSVSTFTNIARR